MQNEQVRKAYIVELVILDKDKVPPKMRTERWWDIKECRFYLSVGGRLTSTYKKSLVNSHDLAEKLMKHWLPILTSRSYGEFTIRVNSITPGKWEKKWMVSNSINLSESIDKT